MILPVILSVLKWIGIVAGVLLLVLVILLALVLFVPIRYRAQIKIPETVIEEGSADRLKETMTFSLSAHWLLHLVSMRYSYPDAQEWVVRPKFLSRFMGGADTGETKKRSKNPYEVFSKIQYTISSVCDKIDEVRALLESETFARAKTCLIRQASVLLKGVWPKKSRAHVQYGIGDPFLTGEVLALHGMLYPVTGRILFLHADFERRIIGTDAYLCGRVRLFTVLKCVLILYFNKDIRRVRARWQRIRRKEDESESV